MLRHRVDIFEILFPVAKPSFVHLFITLSASYNQAFHRLDVKNALLHGDLNEVVYITQPSGFVAWGELGKVYKLNKSLYFLKQSPRALFGVKCCGTLVWLMKNFKRPLGLLQFFDFQMHFTSYEDDIVITGSEETGIK